MQEGGEEGKLPKISIHQSRDSLPNDGARKYEIMGFVKYTLIFFWGFKVLPSFEGQV